MRHGHVVSTEIQSPNLLFEEENTCTMTAGKTGCTSACLLPTHQAPHVPTPSTLPSQHQVDRVQKAPASKKESLRHLDILKEKVTILQEFNHKWRTMMKNYLQFSTWKCHRTFYKARKLLWNWFFPVLGKLTWRMARAPWGSTVSSAKWTPNSAILKRKKGCIVAFIPTQQNSSGFLEKEVIPIEWLICGKEKTIPKYSFSHESPALILPCVLCTNSIYFLSISFLSLKGKNFASQVNNKQMI